MPRRAEILAIGLEHVLPKVANWVLSLEQQGIRTVIYTQDIYGLSRKVLSQYSIPVYFVPEFLGRLSRWLFGLPLFLYILFWYRPKHVEVYDPELCNGFSIVCVNLARILGFAIVVLNRGGLFGYNKLLPTKQVYIRNIYNYSKLVMVKELYMEKILTDNKLVSQRNFVFVHNRVNIGNNPIYDKAKPPIVLYLNSFLHRKHPELLIYAAEIILKKTNNFIIYMVGDLDTKQTHKPNDAGIWGRFSKEDLIQLAQGLRIEEHIKIFPFSSNPRSFFDDASIFVLPADEVFCNFSLLEAMERGIPPIISDVPGSERIVDHGINGYRVRQEANEIAQYIIALLANEEKRQEMGRAARAKVERDFDINKLGEILADLYRKRVWDI